MKIVLGGDHAGFHLKQKLLEVLQAKGHEVLHIGYFSPDPVDFPDVARQVCDAILSGECARGVMVCGSGVGAAIACNKVPGIRASVVHDLYTAHQCVEHDDVQVMALGASIVGDIVAAELIDVFLNARFADTEELRVRVAKLGAMDGSR
jgi:ribose 5-phosphate isomerase B